MGQSLEQGKTIYFDLRRLIDNNVPNVAMVKLCKITSKEWRRR